MSKHEFMHSTPRDIRLRFETVTEQKKEEAKQIQFRAWLSGLYVKCAVASALSSKNKYPENPLLSTNLSDLAERTGKTEEELNGEKVMMTMLVMEANAKLADQEF